MNKRLYIIRHGKSSWETVVADFDRPLTERGVRDAYDMAERLEKAGLVPGEVYCSPANRAMHTASIMMKSWGLEDDKFHMRRKLYLPEEEDIIEVLSEIDNSIHSVAIFGHNPTFTNFANRFVNPTIENIPTTGVIVLGLELSEWNDVYSAKVIDTIFDYPKRIR